MSVRAEAEGLGHATATFNGRGWRVPLDVDEWPPVDRCIGLSVDRVLVVDHGATAVALCELLGDQWDEFVEVAPRRRDLVPAAHAFAAAVGIPASTEPGGSDLAFGGIPRLLAVLRQWPTAVESDLNRFWGLDYRDRWRFDADGFRRLTLRQIFARISHLPADSALAIALGRRSPMELLLMDIYEPLAGRVHPSRPLSAEDAAERRKAAEAKKKALDAYERRREQRRMPELLETARANAVRGG